MDRSILSCCDDEVRIDFSKMDVPYLFGYIYWDWNFTWTLLWFILYPCYWIAVSQWEYRNGHLRKFFGGSYIACGLFALTLIPMSIYRNCRFLGTVRRQPEWWLLRQNGVLWTGHGLVLLGLILVLSSFRVLGLWASLLGDFFGIHEKRQDIRHFFPYTWFQHAMYCGSLFMFLGYSLVFVSQAGVFLSLVAMVMYLVAIHYEYAVMCRYHHLSVDVGVQAEVEHDAADAEEVEETLQVDIPTEDEEIVVTEEIHTEEKEERVESHEETPEDKKKK